MTNQGGVVGNGGSNLVNIMALANDKDKPIRCYAYPLFQELKPSIMWPEIEANHFELKPVIFQMLEFMGRFSGQPTDDPHLHLRSFLEVSESFKLEGVSPEALRLRLFPFSLRDSARSWLSSFPPESITTLNELTEKFLMRYFPAAKISKFRNEIMSFRQEDEYVSEAWERFKELLRRCPYHRIPNYILIETFYFGLNLNSRMMLDASASGALMSKSYEEACALMDLISSNNYQWEDPRNAPALDLDYIGLNSKI